MSYKISDNWLFYYSEKNHEKQVEQYLEDYRMYIYKMDWERQKQECISNLNLMKRGSLWSCEALGMNVVPGDICYTDFGTGYINECAYQHFCLVTSIVNRKAHVIPMTSNKETVRLAKRQRKKHLFYIGRPEGLKRETSAYLNDSRFINTARIIGKCAHIDTSSKLFIDICQKVKDCIG